MLIVEFEHNFARVTNIPRDFNESGEPTYGVFRGTIFPSGVLVLLEKGTLSIAQVMVVGWNINDITGLRALVRMNASFLRKNSRVTEF